MNTMIALLKRETWEHRSIWMVPAVMASLAFVMFLWSTIYAIPHHSNLDVVVSELERLDHARLATMQGMLLSSLLVTLGIASSFIMYFYLLDALYSERRDRSILFWKSLPVTDTATVASKWLTAIVTIPLAAAVIALVAHALMTAIGGVVVMFWGANAWTVAWSTYNPFPALWNGVIVYLVMVLWYLPLYAWLLLASAWAKKAPFLWAVLPPVAIGLVERIFLDSSRFFDFISERMTPFFAHGNFVNDMGDNIEAFNGHLRIGGLPQVKVAVLGELFATPGFWYGLVFAAACTAGAIWLRRYRDES